MTNQVQTLVHRPTKRCLLGQRSPTTQSSHFGLRAQFRQIFFLAPDFEQNYLTIKHRTTTFEPGVGFFIRF